MSLNHLLAKKKKAILDKWFDRVLGTYPIDMQGFFRQQSDRFVNPVGSTILASLEGLFQELLKKGDYEKARSFLEDILRIRSVQDFSPSQAVVFLPLLKGVLKDEIGEEVRQNRLYGEWLELESRIDEFLLLAFDIYMACREKIFQLKTQELRSRKAFSSLRSHQKENT
jgi:hypothetical protein